MSEIGTDAVLGANAAFYRAMRMGDLAAMARLWSERRPVSCAHPGGPVLFGRDAVIESWRAILHDTAPPPIVADAPRPVVTGPSALVLCVERIGAHRLMAVNTFLREDGRWRMIGHRAEELPSDERR